MSENIISNDLISRHIFLFPFKWENSHKAGDSFDDRTSLSKFHDILLNGAHSKAAEKGLKWERQLFQIGHLNQFNEFNYFYDYVREILYDLGEEGENEISHLFAKSAGKSLLRHYELTLPEEKLHYCIEIAEKKKDENGDEKTSIRSFRLDIDSIMLNLYETGVGVLVFFLGNRDQSQKSPEDILLINQFGRRIMPPFLGIDSEKVGKVFDFGNSSDELKAALLRTQSAELAKSISIQPKDSIGEGLAEFREDFSDFGEMAAVQKGAFKLPKFISALFPENSIETSEPDWNRDQPTQKILLKPVLDDRMFVLCWYGGMKEIEDEFRKNQLAEAEMVGFEPNPDFLPSPDFLQTISIPGRFWYRFVFVDGKGMSIDNHSMADDLIRKHTYQRWIPYTYYGVSRYSMVCLTSSLATLRSNNAAFLPQHIESIYYKLFELAIVQRASVLRFADEVTHLSHFHVDKKENAEETYTNLAARVKDLYQHYIQFVNKIYFREVTAQEQGIEMYDMLQKHLRIETQVEDLDKEIEELHGYVKMLEEEIHGEREQKTANKLNAITIIGAIFLIPSFILTIYGMEPYKLFMESMVPQTLLIVLIGLICLGVFTLGAVGFVPRFLRPKFTPAISASIALLIAVFMLCWPLRSKKSATDPPAVTIQADSIEEVLQPVDSVSEQTINPIP